MGKTVEQNHERAKRIIRKLRERKEAQKQKDIECAAVKGANLRINELKFMIYQVIKKSQLDVGTVNFVVKEVLSEINQVNNQAVQKELYDYLNAQEKIKGR